MEYTTLTEVEKLAIARDALRARESEYYSLSLSPGQPGAAQRMAQLDEDAARYRAEIDRLVGEVGDVVPEVVPDTPKTPDPQGENPKGTQELTGDGKPLDEPEPTAAPKPKTTRRRKPAAKKKDE